MKIKGFTLIELIIVILIALILSIVATAKFGGFYIIKLNSAASRLLSDITYTRQLSITTQARYGVRFDVANNNYSVYNYATGVPIANPLNPGSQFVVDFDNISEYSGIRIASINFGGGSNGVVFDSLGIPLSSSGAALASEGTCVLTYQTSSRTVYVTPNTGNSGIR